MSGAAHIVIAKEVHGPGLAVVQRLVGAENVTVLPPSSEDVHLPDDLAAGCTVLFTDYLPANLSSMMNLKWLQLASAGYEHILDHPLAEMRIQVTNGSGVNDPAIAEWCIAMMILFERDLRGLLEMQQRRGWNRRARYQSEIRGRRVGILGYGSVGREVARLGSAMGMDVWVMSRSPIGPRPGHYAVPGTGDPQGIIPARTFALTEMAEFLPKLDYLILTLPLSASTRGIIGEQELRLLAPSAVLLNPSRGPLIDEQALLQALEHDWIAGAALDTHFYYPLPPEHPLWRIANVVLTPHISGSTSSRYFLERLWDLFAQNLARNLRGEPLLNQIAASDLSSR